MARPSAAKIEVDALIVGCGPAGLTAAIYLGRFRRSFALVDAGQSRLGLIPITHNHPGFPDGVKGRVLWARMKTQAEHYGAVLATGVADWPLAAHFAEARLRA